MSNTPDPPSRPATPPSALSSAGDLKRLRGHRAGPTAWRVVDQRTIDTFAGITGDRQWIHVDVERARRESPFGTTIAHGNLTLSLIDGFRDELMPSQGIALGINYGYERVRFPVPVPAGGRVRGHLEIAAITPRPDGWWQVIQRFTVELEGSSKPACVADSVVWVRPVETEAGPGA